MAAGLVIAALLGASTGCSRAEPSPVPTPKLVWKNGVRPSSPLEKNRYVKLLRRSLLAEAVAWNSGHFDIRQLTSVDRLDQIRNQADDYASQYEFTTVQLGPVPFQPITVSTIEHGTVTRVRVCVAGEDEWVRRSPEFFGRSWPSVVVDYEFSIDSDGRMDFYGQGTGVAKCDGSTVPVALFDPAPKLRQPPITSVKSAPDFGAK